MKLRLRLVLLFFCMNQTIIAAKPSCKSTENCNCSRPGKNYVFDCPADDPRVTISLLSGSEAKVACLKEDINWDTENLPVIKGNLKLLTFTQCPIPKSSFKAVIRKLGINNIKELQFKFSTSQNVTLTSNYFKELDDLEKLMLSDDNIKIIDEDVFKSMNKLIEVELRSNTIQLKEKLFQYLSKLELLDLSENELLHLPSGFFKRLIELRVLYLQHNKLTNLNKTAFNRLQNLEMLDLHNNMLGDLSKEVFIGLRSLKKINLAMNNLQHIPRNLFLQNTELTFISLERNLLTHLPKGLFSNFTKLEVILINECKVSSLSNELFYGSINLQNISLRNNAIQELPADIFKDLMELRNLDLSYNKLTDLPDNLFSSLIHLQSLRIENNMLAYISENLLYNLENIEIINLKNNRISFIHSQAFTRNINIKEIILSKNYLNIFEDENDIFLFNNNLNLEIVDLSYNNITNMGQDWWTSINLKMLDYSFNQITYLDFTSLVGVPRKLTLNLSHNKLQTINFQSVDAMVRIQENVEMSSINEKITVIINYNPIECDCYIHDFVRYFDGSIDPAVPALFTVVADDLACAGPKNFIGFPVKKLEPKVLTCTLQQLDIDSPCPQNCECFMSLWDNSFIVDCKNRSLRSLPEIILPEEDIFNQTKVYLQENFLTIGPGENMGYENVTELDLSSNNIYNITWIPPNIQVLHMDDNNISYLSYHLLTMLNLSSLTEIALGNNPWDCNCLTVNFTKFLVLHSTNKQIDTNNIKCKANGNFLIRLSKEELCANNIAFMLGIGLSFLALICIGLLGTFYANKQKIKVWMFAHRMCLWCVSEEEIDKDKLYDVFISYAHQDEDFVLNELVPMLEKDPQPYKLCIHIRDWIAGKYISEQISRSVQDSRRTLVVVSPNFLQSVWGKVEFKTAHTQAMAEGRSRVIVLIYGDVDIKADLDEDLKAYVATNTYVKWGERWFWNKLKYALPHSQKLHQPEDCQIPMLDL